MGKGLFCGINQPADPAEPSEMEKKHTPVIQCPDTVESGEPFQVTITVGHGMEEGHHIQWIDLYSGNNFYSKVLLTPMFTKAEATLTVEKGGAHRTSTLRAVARCNLHGMWEGNTDITVN